MKTKNLFLAAAFAFICLSASSQVILEWEVRHNGAGNVTDIPNGLAVDDSGNVYITGQSNEVSSDDFMTIKYNSAGVKQWQAVHDGGQTFVFDDVSQSIGLDVAGNVYVTGHTNQDNTGYDFATIKYDNNGNQQWIKLFDADTLTDAAVSIAVDDAGNVYVTGPSETVSGFPDYRTIKYNTLGVEQWNVTYVHPDSLYDAPSMVIVDDAGNVYVTGYVTTAANAADFATIKYNSLGVEQWVAILDGGLSLDDFANSIAVDSAGNVYVSGYGQDILNNDYITVKYNSAGVQQWLSRYNGDCPLFCDDISYAMTIDKQGNVYVTGMGSDTSSSSQGYQTVKYNSAGDTVWVARYDNPSGTDDAAFGIAVDDNGNVYVTGYSLDVDTLLQSDDDFVTIAYNSLGVEQWRQQYNGPGDGMDDAMRIAVDDNGNVYVTGFSEGSGSGFDFATLKYSCLAAVADFGYTDSVLTVTFIDSSLNATSHLWDFGDGNTSILLNPTHTYAAPGTYQVCLSVANNCSQDSTCDSVNVSSITKVRVELFFPSDIRVIPNPFSDAADIIISQPFFNTGEVIFTMYDLLGRQVKQITKNNSPIRINRGGLSEGMYFYKVVSDGEILGTGKIIVQ